jgi:hypothetical protein
MRSDTRTDRAGALAPPVSFSMLHHLALLVFAALLAGVLGG